MSTQYFNPSAPNGQPTQANNNRISRIEILASLAADNPISRRQLLPNLLAAITLARLRLQTLHARYGGVK